jgi:hypothetical protein
MKTQRLKNIQKEASKARQKTTLPQAIKNSASISRKYKDLEMGFEVEDAVETRSNAELLQDQQFLNSKIQPLLNKLFQNDGIEMNTYEQFLFGNNISFQEFQQIYPDLLKMGSHLIANDVIIRSQILVDNLRNTGNSSSVDITPIIDAIEDAKNLLQNEYQQNNIPPKKANDMTDRLDAFQQIIKNSENMPTGESQLSNKKKQKFTDDILDIMTQPAYRT